MKATMLHISFAVAFLVLLSAEARAQRQPATPAPEQHQPLGTGDVVFVEVYRHPDLSATAAVDPAGNIQLPIVGDVGVAGLDVNEAEARITASLKQILKQPRVTVSRNVIGSVSSGERTPAMRTELVRLRNANAQTVYNALEGMNSAGGTLGVAPDTNSLIVTDTPNTIENILAAAAQLDHWRAQLTQVHIETKIIAIKATALAERGGRWFTDDGHANRDYPPLSPQTGSPAAGREGTAPLFDARPGGGHAQASTPQPGQMFFRYLNTDLDRAALIDTLMSENLGELLATPVIRTENHKSEKVTMTAQLPYTITENASSDKQTNIAFLDIGIVLEITPHVRHTPEGGAYVQLEIEPAVSFASGIANGAPVRHVSSTSSAAPVGNGETLAISGITHAAASRENRQAAAFDQTSLLGELFNYAEQAAQERELLILITPRILDGPEDLTAEQMINSASKVHGAYRLPARALPAERRRE
ncbi:MAG: polysaccharide biosynthesis/export family protein [Candidatus Hydrogenedentota bacterium]